MQNVNPLSSMTSELHQVSQGMVEITRKIDDPADSSGLKLDRRPLLAATTSGQCEEIAKAFPMFFSRFFTPHFLCRNLQLDQQVKRSAPAPLRPLAQRPFFSLRPYLRKPDVTRLSLEIEVYNFASIAVENLPF